MKKTLAVFAAALTVTFAGNVFANDSETMKHKRAEIKAECEKLHTGDTKAIHACEKEKMKAHHAHHKQKHHEKMSAIKKECESAGDKAAQEACVKEKMKAHHDSKAHNAEVPGASEHSDTNH